MQFLRPSLFVLLMVLHSVALASSAPAEGEGAAAPMPKEQKEYIEKSSKLNSLASKISEAEKQFAALVHHKSEAKDAVAKQHIIREMIAIADQRNKDVEAYNKLKNDLELRYPNQGEKLNRSYETQTKRSMEELEGGAGLDELLTRTKKVVERKFAPFMEEEPKQQQKASKQHAAPASEEPPRLRLEK